MEPIVDFDNAHVGDLIEHKNKFYSVINEVYGDGCGEHIKTLKIVKNYPLLPFTRVLTMSKTYTN